MRILYNFSNWVKINPIILFVLSFNKLCGCFSRDEGVYHIPRLCWDRKFHYIHCSNLISDLIYECPSKEIISRVFSINLSMRIRIESRRYTCESKSKFLFAFFIINIKRYAYNSYVHYIACYHIFLWCVYIYSHLKYQPTNKRHISLPQKGNKDRKRDYFHI